MPTLELSIRLLPLAFNQFSVEAFVLEAPVSVPTSMRVPLFPFWIFFSAGRQRVIDIALRASHSHPKEEVTSIANCDRNHALHELFLKHPLRWLALQV
jgi:hypothetical protein